MVRDIWRNFALESEHKYRRAELRRHFPLLAACPHGQFLSLYRYLVASPERYFSKKAFDSFYEFLSELSASQASMLGSYLHEHHWQLSQAYFFLNEINSFPWHDEFEALDDYETLRFVDRHIHPAYLRLLEAAYYPFIRILAWFSRIARNSGTDGLDLFNAVQELQKSALAELTLAYRHVVRNGIGHGGVIFGNHEIEYRDKKGNREVVPLSEVIRLFDDLLDICNGLALASKVFFLSQLPNSANIPQQILLDELKAETESPWWRIEGAVTSSIRQGPQLILYARPNSRDYSKIQYYSFLTAALAEYLSPGYSRYFLSLRSEKATPGFAAFDGERLAEIRHAGPTSVMDYGDALENNVVYYVPYVKLPKLLGKLDFFLQISRTHFRLALERVRNQRGRSALRVRQAAIHRNGNWVVLNGAVVLDNKGITLERQDVKAMCHRLIESALRRARQKHSRSDAARYLPLGWAKISILQKDYRKRRIASFGLAEDLVCTIQISRLPRIKVPDILGSEIEQYGQFRIAWNRAWIDRFRY